MKYSIFPFERALAFQITNQEESITHFVKRNGFVARNGWRVVVDEVPELDITRKVIFLRGNKEDSNLRVDRRYHLPSNLVRDFVIREIRDALDELQCVVNNPRPVGIIGHVTENYLYDVVDTASEAENNRGRNVANKPEVSE